MLHKFKTRLYENFDIEVHKSTSTYFEFWLNGEYHEVWHISKYIYFDNLWIKDFSDLVYIWIKLGKE